MGASVLRCEIIGIRCPCRRPVPGVFHAWLDFHCLHKQTPPCGVIKESQYGWHSKRLGPPIQLTISSCPIQRSPQLARAVLLLKAEHFIIKNETFPGATRRQLEDFSRPVMITLMNIWNVTLRVRKGNKRCASSPFAWIFFFLLLVFIGFM